MVVLLNTLSWRQLIPTGERVPLTTLAPMLVAADALNAVNPIAYGGGELMRVSLLRRVLPARAAAISVTLGSMTQFVGQALFILSGLPIALSLIRGRELRLGLLLLCALLLSFLCLVLFVGFSRSFQDRIGRLVARTRWLAARWASVPERWQALLGETLTALRERPRAFVSSVTASLLAWQAGVIETFVILRLLQLPVGWPQALAIEVLGVTIEGILFFVPAKMGTQEGGKVLIFLAMGLPPAKGFALGLIRRLRELAWAAAGLVALGRYQRR